MKHEFWISAYRPRSEKTLLEDTATPFRAIPNTWRYWTGDPHLFEDGGKTWVFAELYDRILRRGVIGCCELTENGPTKWKVCLKMPFHLSYPHIFRREGGIWMIPESYVGGEIGLYKAVSFPYRWERVRAVKPDTVAVDTTWVHWEDRRYLLTQAQTDDNTGALMLLKEDGTVCWTGTPADPYVRPAGPLFEHHGKLLRPSQNCAGGYGIGLRFNEVLAVSDDDYQEKFLLEISPDQIQCDWSYPVKGIHTYGQSDRYEVIDLKSFEIDLFAPVMRPVWAIWRRIKKLFVRN